MNIVYKLNVDNGNLDNALKALRGHVAKGRALDNEESAVKEHFKYIGVSLETPSAKDKLDQIRQKRAALGYDTRAEFDECFEAFANSYYDCETPNGEMIDQNVVYLLDKGMYTTPKQLEHVQKKFADNLTMLRMIESYAAKKNWPDFDVQIDNGQYVTALAGLRDLRDGVLHDHSGYNAMFVEKYDTADKLMEFYRAQEN